MTSGFSWIIGWPSEARHSWSFFFEVLGFDFSAKSSEERGLRGFADIKRELTRVGKWYGGFRGISLGSAPTIWAVPAPWEALISINEVGPKLIRGGENLQLADFVVFFFSEKNQWELPRNQAVYLDLVVGPYVAVELRTLWHLDWRRCEWLPWNHPLCNITTACPYEHPLCPINFWKIK